VTTIQNRKTKQGLAKIGGEFRDCADRFAEYSDSCVSGLAHSMGAKAGSPGERAYKSANFDRVLDGPAFA
jgi:hypothetical protein